MKAVCLLSGGPDSAVSAALAKREGYELYCISFDYGQRARKELESARSMAKFLGAKEHRIIDMSYMKDIYGRGVTALTDESMEMPESFKPTVVVPFRNGIMLSIAAGYASALGARAIFYGAHRDDSRFYPDCRDEFVRAMERAVLKGTDEKIEIKAPLLKLRKSDVIKLAAELGIPLEQTWSCYLSEKLHCGACESCMNRKRAFKEAGLEDRTKYSSRS
ncbi:MAG: 7-cyano-7-deazaguanine synthase QueC [Candidatus Hadarchaeales archaeon]